MTRKIKRAFVRGRFARYWLFRGECYVLRHPRTGETAEVPAFHLADAVMMDEHVRRLEGKGWVTRGAVEELLEMVAGARP